MIHVHFALGEDTLLTQNLPLSTTVLGFDWVTVLCSFFVIGHLVLVWQHSIEKPALVAK